MRNNSDYTEQLETEKMISVYSLRAAVSLLETLALDGAIPAAYGANTSRVLDTCWTALAWIREWELRQADEDEIAAELEALGARMASARAQERARVARAGEGEAA